MSNIRNAIRADIAAIVPLNRCDPHLARFVEKYRKLTP
jgi:hypothetical protein